ncbi:hypothetical protein L3Y34_003431 [Caenorhabditis briggsae]|uniref:DUF38 domain-containing protein n=1 Tax=Caenorhabditis briggsae TaxID=6238 RepID=A0AAE9D447_CAEBR|nr:hypothetical protein L3Y34_003431 [Caenorhabditis briggsae]
MDRRYYHRTPPTRYNTREELFQFRREQRRQQEELEYANLNPFFQRMLPGPSINITPTRTPQTNAERFTRARRRPTNPIERERNQYERHLLRNEGGGRSTPRRSPRKSAPSTVPVTPVKKKKTLEVNIERHSKISSLFPLDPPTPFESEEETPTPSRQHTPSPPRSPVPEPKEYYPRNRPNTPEDGIPKEWDGLAEDAITQGLSWALSWVDHLKPSRLEVEERIKLPRFWYNVPRRTMMCLVAHRNVDETIFHTVEVKEKSEMGLRTALSEFVKQPPPTHRIRLKVSKHAEVALHQKIVDRFEDVEYFRLDTKYPNLWILHQIYDENYSVSLSSKNGDNFSKTFKNSSIAFKFLNYIGKIGVFECFTILSTDPTVKDEMKNFAGRISAKNIGIDHCDNEMADAVLQKMKNGVDAIRIHCSGDFDYNFDGILAMSQLQSLSYWHIENYKQTDNLYKVAQSLIDRNSKIGFTFHVYANIDGSVEEFSKYFAERIVSESEKRV